MTCMPLNHSTSRTGDDLWQSSLMHPKTGVSVTVPQGALLGGFLSIVGLNHGGGIRLIRCCLRVIPSIEQPAVGPRAPYCQRKVEILGNPKSGPTTGAKREAMLEKESGGQGWNQACDTRIFSSEVQPLSLLVSRSPGRY